VTHLGDVRRAAGRRHYRRSLDPRSSRSANQPQAVRNQSCRPARPVTAAEPVQHPLGLQVAGVKISPGHKGPWPGTAAERLPWMLAEMHAVFSRCAHRSRNSTARTPTRGAGMLEAPAWHATTRAGAGDQMPQESASYNHGTTTPT
jgi:hypothetical protein